MNYFEILNLTREPFSNSPDPDSFFASYQHVSCLHNLELAIRMHRGINTVTGEVGTGKTTLCRQLIRRFKEDNNTLASLILDPYFSSEMEFLRHVATLFRVHPVENNAASEWQLKERIKDYLFRKGVNEGKTVLLIIDEGQKITPSCLEILREFLNYETNSAKLLQIVIFAQKEFERVLKLHDNLADRINLHWRLEPMSFQDTRAMILHRLDQAGAAHRGTKLFSRPALWMIYRKSGGYPRKIITICHKIILAMIIKDRKKAGLLLARSAADRLPHTRTGGILRPALVYSAGLIIAIGLLFHGNISSFLQTNAYSPEISSASPTANTARSGEAQPRESISTYSGRPTQKPAGTIAGQTPKMGDGKNQTAILGRVRVESKDTLSGLIRKIYGPENFSPAIVAKILAVNPRMDNPDLLSVGEVLSFPDLGLPVIPEGRWWINIADFDGLQEACEQYDSLAVGLPDMLLIPRFDQSEQWFSLVLGESYPEKAAAAAYLKKLPGETTEKAVIVKLSHSKHTNL